MKLGDIVEFRSTIWRGKRGRILEITPNGSYRVAIPNTISSNWVYAPSAVKLIKSGKE